MTAAHRRGARHELRTAKALGVPRVRRSRGQGAPDLETVRLPCGVALVVECKHRARLPALITGALEQARRYVPGAVPVAVVQELGGRAVACLDLDVFRRLVGLAPVAIPTQPPLPLACGGRRG